MKKKIIETNTKICMMQIYKETQKKHEVVRFRKEEPNLQP